MLGPHMKLNNEMPNTLKPKHPHLRTTSSLIEDTLLRENFPDLSEMLQSQNSSDTNWNFLKSHTFKPLPEFMLLQYDSLQVSSFMGIFPEINRVWMTIDNRLYLWNYEMEGGDLINTFEDPDQIIVNVSLVKPIPGVFLEQIEVIIFNLVFISCIDPVGNNSFGYCIF